MHGASPRTRVQPRVSLLAASEPQLLLRKMGRNRDSRGLSPGHAVRGHPRPTGTVSGGGAWAAVLLKSPPVISRSPPLGTPRARGTIM